MRPDWNREEVKAIVEAYFWMLGEQIAGRKSSRKDVIRRLQFGRLAARNESAISRKFSNISAVLSDMGAPWVRGYAPLAHTQRALRDHVVATAKLRGILTEQR